MRRGYSLFKAVVLNDSFKKWNKVKVACDVLSGLGANPCALTSTWVCVKRVAAFVDADTNGEWTVTEREVKGCEAQRKFDLSSFLN